MSAERKKDKQQDKLVGMPFDEALARLIQTDPVELKDVFDNIEKVEKETQRYVKERRESIKKGARRAPKRFRL